MVNVTCEEVRLAIPIASCIYTTIPENIRPAILEWVWTSDSAIFEQAVPGASEEINQTIGSVVDRGVHDTI